MLLENGVMLVGFGGKISTFVTCKLITKSRDLSYFFKIEINCLRKEKQIRALKDTEKSPNLSRKRTESFE